MEEEMDQLKRRLHWANLRIKELERVLESEPLHPQVSAEMEEQSCEVVSYFGEFSRRANEYASLIYRFLIRHEGIGFTLGQIAAQLRVDTTSSSFAHAVQQLQAKQLIQRSVGSTWLVKARRPACQVSGGELESLLSRLPANAGELYQIVAESAPDWLSLSEAANKLSLKRTSSTWTMAVALLRNNQLVSVEKGHISLKGSVVVVGSED